MSKLEIKKSLESFLGTARTKNDELQFHCPFCQHPKRKFNVNTVSHAWHCWVCGAKGRSLFSLAKKLQASPKILSFFRSLRPGKIKKSDQDNIRLPGEFQPIYGGNPNSPDFRNAVRYLKQRGLTSEDVLRYNIGYAESGSYSGMIIIPSYDAEGSLNYFTSRAFYDAGPKHLNPPASRNVVGYEVYVNWSEPINIVEGPFDAITVGENTIPLFGKTLSKSLIESIILNKVQRINLLLDDDALKEALKHAERFMGLGIQTHVIDLPGKDPNDLGREAVHKLIADSDPLTFSKLMEYKLYA